ncbi:MarR family transcriptional regulator [uncultured Leifsonia sp.]|uniref:MarR family winged helix-turn-helix transcriptional regulator n=1 Tax=Leifsonia sp. TaxID=1870902 RepID=UPI0028D32E2C|nr:MarR family transcriptional regulator [uncultured Leifsonia sp.]
MRRRTRESMRMGENDLLALRFLLREQSEGRVATPADIATLLRLKSSSVTVMLDRLTASGHVRREPHPSDRRKLAIIATPGADEEVRHTLGAMHGRLLAAAEGLGPADAELIEGFLARLTGALDTIDRSGQS